MAVPSMQRQPHSLVDLPLYCCHPGHLLLHGRSDLSLLVGLLLCLRLTVHFLSAQLDSAVKEVNKSTY